MSAWLKSEVRAAIGPPYVPSHSYKIKDVPKPACSRFFNHLSNLRGLSLQIAGLTTKQDMRILVSEEWSRRHATGKLAPAAKGRFLYIKERRFR